MRQSLNTLILAMVAGTLLTTCKSPEQSAGSSKIPKSPFGALTLAESNNYFTLDLFRNIQDSERNMVCSPYSISTVLAMCYSGAGGETAEQMSEVLYFPPPGELEKAYFDLNNQILSIDTLPGTEINLANAIWVQENFKILPEYTEKINTYYRGALSLMDFVRPGERENSRLRINKWVEENTGNRIRDLLAPGVLDANTRMVLTNAIYFNGKWRWPFDRHRTAPSVFHISSGETLMTDFMHINRPLPYYEDEELQALRLPYKGGRLSMTILLPKKVDGWKMVSRVIDLERLNAVESQFTDKEVLLSLPKFTLEQKLDLRKVLAGMGMEEAFERYADFSGMTGEKNLFIDEVVHKAFIEVSETGTEAAAATAGIMSLKAALTEEPVRFNADHPFIYLIRDMQTGCIFFLGRLVQP